jgi:hypothetical protein
MVNGRSALANDKKGHVCAMQEAFLGYPFLKPILQRTIHHGLVRFLDCGICILSFSPLIEI